MQLRIKSVVMMEVAEACQVNAESGAVQNCNRNTHSKPTRHLAKLAHTLWSRGEMKMA